MTVRYSNVTHNTRYNRLHVSAKLCRHQTLPKTLQYTKTALGVTCYHIRLPIRIKLKTLYYQIMLHYFIVKVFCVKKKLREKTFTGTFTMYF